MRIQPRVEWREDKEDVGDLFCPGFSAKSRSNFKFSSLAKACLKVSKVPEGRCDRSLARSAWESTIPKDPSRRVRCESFRCKHESIENVISFARSYRTLWDGSFGVVLSQALRARLRSVCPSGTGLQTVPKAVSTHQLGFVDK